MEILIRTAQLKDAEAIHTAHMKSIREICVKDHGPDEIRGWGFREYNESLRLESIKKDPMWVVEVDGVVEGYAHLSLYEKDNEKHAYLWALYLTPKVVGRGFGLKLANLMLDRAREYGAKSITLNSSLTAHQFYKKLGFEDIGPILLSEVNGYPVRNYSMAKRL